MQFEGGLMPDLPLAAASIRWPCKWLGSREEGQDQGWHCLCFDRLVGGIREMGRANHTRYRVRCGETPTRGVSSSSRTWKTPPAVST
jgi:hypothetical protein